MTWTEITPSQDPNWTGTPVQDLWTWDADHFTFDDNLHHTMDGWHIDADWTEITGPSTTWTEITP